MPLIRFISECNNTYCLPLEARKLISWIFPWKSLITEPATDALIRRRFGQGLPPINEIVKNTSLMLINQYYALTGPRPYAPNVVEVGGLQVGPEKALPKVIIKWD